MDNVNNTCAPKMADGRLFSDYRSGYIRDNVVLAGFQNGNDHRHFLQNNAEELMAAHSNRANANECNSCDISKSPKAPVVGAPAKAPLTLKADKPAAVVTKKESFSVNINPDNFMGDRGILMGVLAAVVGYGVYKVCKIKKLI